MPESVYKVIELIGTSKDSWEKAATAAVFRTCGGGPSPQPSPREGRGEGEDGVPEGRRRGLNA